MVLIELLQGEAENSSPHLRDERFQLRIRGKESGGR
ncbi:MAG: hypothetical protein JWQ71_3881 [Pedosphaera sp.]|nr:hypothetical protein [Pedosphaera sp.]